MKIFYYRKDSAVVKGLRAAPLLCHLSAFVQQIAGTVCKLEYVL
jgi:hypothetical protein